MTESLQEQQQQLGEGQPPVLNDLDLSQNKLTLEEFENVFNSLAGVNVKRLRLFGCPTIDDTVCSHIGDFIRGTAEFNAPLELHLSDCAITDTGFYLLMGAIEEAENVPQVNPRTGKCTPMYVRLENNYIVEDAIREKVHSGIIREVRKSGGDRSVVVDAAGTPAKVDLILRHDAKGYQQKSGDPPAPDHAPPPKAVKDFRYEAAGAWGAGKGGGSVQAGAWGGKGAWQAGAWGGRDGATYQAKGAKGGGQTWAGALVPPGNQNQSKYYACGKGAPGSYGQGSFGSGGARGSGTTRSTTYGTPGGVAPTGKGAAAAQKQATPRGSAASGYGGYGGAWAGSWAAKTKVEDVSAAAKKPRGSVGALHAQADRSRTPAPRSAAGRPPAEESLPHPWQEHWSEAYGIPYYWNSLTGDSTWEKPT